MLVVGGFCAHRSLTTESLPTPYAQRAQRGTGRTRPGTDPLPASGNNNGVGKRNIMDSIYIKCCGFEDCHLPGVWQDADEPPGSQGYCDEHINDVLAAGHKKARVEDCCALCSKLPLLGSFYCAAHGGRAVLFTGTALEVAEETDEAVACVLEARSREVRRTGRNNSTKRWPIVGGRFHYVDAPDARVIMLPEED